MTAPTIGFCRLSAGPTVAFATAGEGPAVVMLPGWLSHVEQMWTHPAAVTARDKLAAGHRFLWYDRRAVGFRIGRALRLHSNDVEQLAAVLDAANVPRCSLSATR